MLRKGGISEKTGEFQIEHTRFWLYPTYVHQQRDGVTADALPLLDRAEAERPAPGVVRLTHFAETSGVYHLHNLPAALLLGGMHCLSAATVKSRFEYKRPGLYVLPVRVYRAARRPTCRRPRTMPDAGVGLSSSATADGRGDAGPVGRGVPRGGGAVGPAAESDGDGVSEAECFRGPLRWTSGRAIMVERR